MTIKFLKRALIACGLTFAISMQPAFAQGASSPPNINEEANKEIARGFYEDLWFSNNTGNFAQYVADEYVVHDIGKRKGMTEPAIRQKEIADMFWKNGELSGSINFMVVEGDLVATRWVGEFNPRTIFGRIFIGSDALPIINVLRIKDGKIVEFWNHRHDIDTPQTLKFSARGLGVGLLIALLPFGWALMLRRKLRRWL